MSKRQKAVSSNTLNRKTIKRIARAAKAAGVYALVGLITFGTLPARVLGETWNQTAAGTYDWDDAGNWTPASFPNAQAATATINAAISGPVTIDLNQAITVGTMTLGLAGNANSYTIDASGGSLTFDVAAGSAALTIAGAASQTITPSITTLDNLTITQGLTAGVFTLGGVDIGNNTLTFAGNGNTSITGGITGGGSGGLVKGGTGRLTIMGPSSYTGNTTVSAGILATSSINDNLGSGTINLGLTTVAGVLEYNGAGETVTQTINANGTTGGAQITAAGTGGLVINNFNFTTNGNKTLTLSGTGATIVNQFNANIVNTTGTTSLLKSGNNTWELTGNNTYTGVTTISAGILRISSFADNLGSGDIRVGVTTVGGTIEYVGNGETTSKNIIANGTSGGVTFLSNGNGALVINALTFTGTSKTLTLGGTNADANTLNAAIVNGTGTNVVSKVGAGTWVLAGANSYSGALTVSEGTLRIAGAGTIGSQAGINVRNGTLDIGATTQTTVGALTLGLAAATLSSNVTMDPGGELNLGNNVTYTAGANVAVGSGGFITGGTVNLNGNRTVTVNDVVLNLEDLTVSSVISDGSVAGSSLIKAGAGTLYLKGVNTYTGTTAIQAGTVRVDSFADNVGLGLIALGNATTGAGTIEYVGGGETVAKTIALVAGTTGGGVIQNNGSGALEITDLQFIGTSVSARTLTLSGSNTDANTVSSAITDNTEAAGTTALTKTGNGKWILTGANSYSGATIVNAGLLQLSGAGQIGATGAVTVQNATLDLDGATQTIGGVLTLGVNANTLSSNLVVGVGGVLDLSNTVTFVGNGSSLAGGFITDGTVNLNGDRVFNVGDAATTTILDDLTVSSVVADGSGSSALVKVGAGNLRLTAINTYTGTTAIQAGAIRLESFVDNVGSGLIALGNATTGAGTLDYVGGGETVAKTIALVAGTTGGGVIQNNGGGALELTDLQFIGTSVSARTLTLSGSNTDANTVSSAITDNTEAAGTTALTKSGNGTWILTGANSYSGATIVNAGLLQLSGAGQIGATGAVTVQNATLDLDGATQTIGGVLTLGVNANTLSSNLVVGAGGVLDLSNTVTFVGNGASQAGGFITGGTVNLNGDRVFNVGDATLVPYDLTIDSAIADGSSVSKLIKAGTGTLRITGPVGFTGGVDIQNGILSVANLDIFTLSGSNIVLGSGTTTGQFDWSGGAETLPTVEFAGTTGGGIVLSNGTGPLTINSLLFSGDGSKTVTFSGSNTDNNTVNDVIANFSATATTTLVKSGAGTWNLTAVNTYTGPTTVNEGVLQLSGSGKISAGTLSVRNGTLDLGGLSQTVGALNIGVAGGTLASNITMGGATMTPGGNMTYAGGLQGTIADGVVLLTANRTLGVVSGTDISGTDLVVSAVIADDGTPRTLTKSGNGVVAFTGANTYGGPTNVSGGALILAGSNGSLASVASTLSGNAILRFDNSTGENGNRMSDAAGITMSAARLELIGGNNALVESVGNVTITTNINAISATMTGGIAAELNLATLNRAARGGVVKFGGDGDITINNVGVNVASNGILNGFATFGDDWVSINSPATPLAIYQTDSNGDAWAATDNVKIVGPIAAPSSNATINSLKIDAAGSTTTLNDGVTLNIGNRGILVAVDGAALNGGLITAPVIANDDFIITVNGPANTFTLGSTLTNNGALAMAFTKAGNGTLVLNSPQAYTSTTTVVEGTLRIGTAMSLSGGLNARAGTTVELAADAGFNGITGENATTTLDLGTSTLFINNVSAGNWIGQIIGSGNIVKSGTATQTISGTSLNTGTVTIMNGQLALSTTNGIMRNVTSFNVSLGGTLNLNNANGAGNADRLNNAAVITLNQGNLQMLGGQTVVFNETVGQLVLAGGHNVLTAMPAASETNNSASTAIITFSAASDPLLHANANATVLFRGGNFLTSTGIQTGVLGGATRGSRVIFTTAPTLANGIIGGWAFAQDFQTNPTDFATYDGANGVRELAAIGGARAIQVEGGASSANVLTGANAQTTLTGNANINSLNVNSGVTDILSDLGGFNLNILSGGLIHSGASTYTVSNGAIKVGTLDTAGSFYVYADVGSTINFNADIMDNGTGPLSLVISGPGTVILTGPKSFTGDIIWNSGNLVYDGFFNDATDLTVTNSNTLLFTYAAAVGPAVTSVTATNYNTGSLLLSGTNETTGPIRLGNEGIGGRLTYSGALVGVGATLSVTNSGTNGVIAISGTNSTGGAISLATISTGTISYSGAITGDSAITATSTLGSILISGTNSGNGDMTLVGDGGVITYSGTTLGDRAITATNNGGGLITVSGSSVSTLPLVLVANSNGGITVSGAQYGAGSTLTATNLGTGAITVSGTNNTGGAFSLYNESLFGLTSTVNVSGAIIGAGSTVTATNVGLGFVQVSGTNASGGAITVVNLADTNGGINSGVNYTGAIVGDSSVTGTNLGLGFIQFSGTNASNAGINLANVGDGRISLTGAIIGAGNGLTLTNLGLGSIVVSGTNNTGGAIFVDNDGAGNVTYSGSIIGTASTLQKTGTGLLALSGSNRFTQDLTIDEGEVRVTTIGLVGANSAAGAGTQINIGDTNNPLGAALGYAGAAASNNRAINLINTNSRINASGSGAVTFTGGVAAVSDNVTNLILGGTGVGGIATQLTDGTAPLTLTKTDTGMWFLSSSNSYTGGLFIKQGSLAFAAFDLGIFGANTINLGDTDNVSAIGMVAFTGTTAPTFVGQDIVMVGSGGVGNFGSVRIDADALPAVSGAGLHIFGVGGTNTAFNSVTFALTDTGSAVLGLQKQDSGYWQLGTTGNTYTGGTTVTGGILGAVPGATFGANTLGNDINIFSTGALLVQEMEAVGTNQTVTLNPTSATAPTRIIFGYDYDGPTAANIAFDTAGTGLDHMQIGGTPTTSPVAVIFDGAKNLTNNQILSSAAAAYPGAAVWLGAGPGGANYTGDTIGVGSTNAYRFGGGGGTFTLSSTDALSGASDLIVGSPDTTARGLNGVLFSKVAQSYSGNTTIGANGILVAAGGSGTTLGTGTNINISGGVLDLRVSGYNVFDTSWSDKTLTIGTTGTVNMTNLHGGVANTAALDTLIINGNNTVAFTATNNYSSSNNISFAGAILNGTTTNTINVNTGKFTIGTMSGAVNTRLVKTGANILELAGSNGLTGTTVLNQGTLLVTHTNGLPTGVLTSGTNVTLDLRQSVENTGDSITFRGGDVNLGTGTNMTFTINVYSLGGTATNGLVRWQKEAGTTTWNLTPSRTSDNITIAVSSVPSYAGGPVTLDDLTTGVYTGGAGYAFEISGLMLLTGTNVVGAAPRTVTLSPGSGELQIAANIIDNPAVSGLANYVPISLIKTGVGTLVLSASNGFAGGLDIRAGDVVFSDTNAAGTGALTTSLNAAYSVLLKGGIDFGTDITVRSTNASQTFGSLSTAGNTFSGNIIVNTAGRTLTLSQIAGGTTAFTGSINSTNGTLAFNKIGLGTVLLSGSNNFSGASTLSNGVLAVQASTTAGLNPLGTGPLALAGGELYVLGAADGATTLLTGTATVAGGARLTIESVGDNTNTIQFASLSRVGNSTLRVLPVSGSLGTTERVVFTNLPVASISDANGSGIYAPWLVTRASLLNGDADYLVGGSAELLAFNGYSTGDLNSVGSGDTVVANLNSVATASGDRTYFALKTDQNLDMGGFTLFMSGSSSSTAPGGIIFNTGGSFSNGTVNMQNSELVIYTSSDTALTSDHTISGNIVGNSFGGPAAAAGLTKFGGGNLVLSFAPTQTNPLGFTGTGSIDINGGAIVTATDGYFGTQNLLGVLSAPNLNIQGGATLDIGDTTQEFGTLSGDGVVVIGADGVLKVGRASSNSAFNGQIAGAVGSTLVKIGTSTVTLNNVSAQFQDAGNAVSIVEVQNGTLILQSKNDSSAGSTYDSFAGMGPDTVYNLKGGTISLRDSGDGTAINENLRWGGDFNVLGSATINADRIAGSSNKGVRINTLSIAARQQLTTTIGNTYDIIVTGTTTLNDSTVINAASGTLNLAGVVTEGATGGTLNKLGGGGLMFGSSNDFSHGLVITAGTVSTGMEIGNIQVFNDTGNYGTGNVLLYPSTVLRIAGANSLPGQLYTYNTVGTNPRLEIGFDGTPADIHLHSYGSGSLQYAENLLSQDIDMGLIGNGKWTIGSAGQTVIMEGALGGGESNVYRFGANGNTFILNNVNAVSDVKGLASSVEVGGALKFDGTVAAGSQATVVFNQDQDYTGTTVIHRGRALTDANSAADVLEIRGSVATSGIVSWGDVRLTNLGSLVNLGDADLIFNAGSQLRLDNTLTAIGTLQATSTSQQLNQLSDDLTLTLNGASLDLVNPTGSITEHIKALVINGGADIGLRGAGTTTLVLDNGGITRLNGATLTLRGNAATALGANAATSGRLFFADGSAPARLSFANMIAPWMVDAVNNSFVDNDPTSTNGLTAAAFTIASTNGTNLGSATEADIVNFTTANQIIAGDLNIAAMRMAINVSGASISGAGQINLWSGGLIHSTTNATISNSIFFGDGTTAVEADIYTATSGNSLTLTGTTTAADLVKFGAGTLVLSGTNAITGTTYVNGGVLTAQGHTALGLANSNYIVLNGASVTVSGTQNMPILNLAGTGNNSFAQSVYLADGLPIAGLNVTGTTNGNGINIGDLIFNNSFTTAPQILVTTGTAFRTTGLTINGAGESIIVNANAVTISGAVSGDASATFTKAGAGALNVVSTNLNTFAGKFAMNVGTALFTGTNALGSMNTVVNGGTITMSNAAAATGIYPYSGGNFTIAGTSLITSGRSAAGTNTFGAVNKMLTFDGATNAIMSINGNRTGDVLSWLGDATFNGSPTINVHNNIVFNIAGNAGGTAALVHKTGTGRLDFGGVNTFDGILMVDQGMVRHTDAGTTGRIVGDNGQIWINPGAGIWFSNTSSLMNTAGTTSQITRFVSTDTLMSIVAVDFNANTATFANIFNNPDIDQRGGGILAIENVNVSNALNMSLIGDGKFYLGSTGRTLLGSNATFSGILTAGAGSAYRLGGGGSAIFISGAGALNGANDVTVGNGSAITGSLAQTTTAANTTANVAMVVISGSNSRSGGTIWVNRMLNVNGLGSPMNLDLRGTNSLGSGGTLNLYGNLIVEIGGSLVQAGGGNSVSIVTNPGARLFLDNTNNGASSNRFGNSENISLNGAILQLRGANLANNTEVLGEISFDLGSGILINRVGAAGGAVLSSTNLVRSSAFATLAIAHTTNTNAAPILGDGGGTGERIVFGNSVALTGGGGLLETVHAGTGMIAPYIVDRSYGQFLQYGANGLAPITSFTTGFTGLASAATGYAINTAATLSLTGSNDGSQILEQNANATTLTLTGTNILDIFALRTNQNILRGPNDADTINIRGQGLIVYSGAAANTRIDPNLVFSADGGTTLNDAYIFTTDLATLQINGKIRAANIIKFGNNSMQIRADQNLFDGTWYVNEGMIDVIALNGLNNRDVVLNGGTASSSAAVTGNGAELRFSMDPQTPDITTVTTGNITAYDQNIIRFTMGGINDRAVRIGDVTVDSVHPVTAADVALAGFNNILTIRVDGLRNDVYAATLHVNDETALNVINGGNVLGGGGTVYFDKFASSSTQNLLKIGNGRLAVGNALSGDGLTGYDGNILVNGGTLVLTDTSINSAANATITVDQGGVLQISAAGVSSTNAAITMRTGAVERWSVNGARDGTYNMADGVSLQINADQTGSDVIGLAGGTIVGYLALDANETLVYRSINNTINLLENSYVGQIFSLNNAIYDLGKVNNDGNPFATSNLLQGAILQLRGAITGAGKTLTKVGNDAVEIYSSGNAIGGLTVIGGTFRTSADNAFTASTLLTLSGSGLLDLDGHDQVFENLSGNAGQVFNSAAGIINSLTLAGTSQQVYGGTIDGNVSLVVAGSGAMQLVLTNTNSYRGNTYLNGGKLAVGMDEALGEQDRADIFFNGGTLRTTATFGIAASRAVTLGAAGGTFDTDFGTTLTLNQGVHGAGSLTKTGGGTLVLDPPDNDYEGFTTIDDGTLMITTPDGLPVGTLLTINAGSNGGRFDMNGFDQTVANIAGNGGNVYNDNANPLVTLTITGATDSSYAGAIGVAGGSGIFLTKNGPGKLTLSGNSAYTGNTFLNGGTLSVSQDTNLGASPNIIFGDPAAVLQVTGVANSTFNHTIDLGVTDGTVEVTEAANNASFTGLVGGNTLTKTGAGQLTFLGANAGFTGPAIVDGGTLATDNSNGLGLAPVTTLNNDGTLKIINNGAANTWTGPITVNGPNAGFDIAGGDVTYTGALLINGGAGVNIQTNGQTLFIDSPATIAGSGNLGIEGGSTVMVNNGTNALTGDVNVFGTLGGNADFSNAGVVTVGAGGTITPGNSIGEMLVNNLTLDGSSDNNAKWVVEVEQGLSDEYTDLDNHRADIIHVAGLLDLSGAFDELDILGLDSVVFGTYPFIIASYGSLLGTFDLVTGLIPTYSIDYHYQGQNLIAIVPEPTTLSVLGLAAGLALLRRRNRR